MLDHPATQMARNAHYRLLTSLAFRQLGDARVPEVVKANLQTAVLNRHNEAGYALSRDIIEPFLNRIITTCTVYHYHHEVCWALWLLLANGFSVSKETGKALSSSDNSLVCLMALDAQRQGRTQEPLQTTAWENMMDGEALFDRQWLLAYEANVKGWLPSKNGADYLNDNEFFRELRTRTGTKSRSGHEYSDTSERTLRGWIHSPVDPLPAVRIGGKILVRRADFDAWLQRHKIEPLATDDVDAIVREVVEGVTVER